MTFTENAEEILAFLEGDTTLSPEMQHEALQNLADLVLQMARVCDRIKPPDRQTDI